MLKRIQKYVLLRKSQSAFTVPKSSKVTPVTNWLGQPNFITHCFFLTLAYQKIGYYHMIKRFSDMQREFEAAEQSIRMAEEYAQHNSNVNYSLTKAAARK